MAINWSTLLPGLLQAGAGYYGAQQNVGNLKDVASASSVPPASVRSNIGTYGYDPTSRTATINAPTPGGYGGASPELISALGGITNTAPEAQDRLQYLRQLAAPEERRGTNTALGRLFSLGQLGSTSGAVQQEALGNVLSKADLARQLTAEDWAQQRATTRFDAALRTVGSGQQQQGADLARTLGLSQIGIQSAPAAPNAQLQALVTEAQNERNAGIYGAASEALKNLGLGDILGKGGAGVPQPGVPGVGTGSLAGANLPGAEQLAGKVGTDILSRTLTEPLSRLFGAGGGGAAGAGAASNAIAGLNSLGTLGGLTSTGLGSAATGSLASAAAPGASLSGMLGGSGSIASQTGGMGAAIGASGGGTAAGGAGAAGAGAAPGAAGAGGLGTLGTIAAGAGVLAGGAAAYEGIRKGNEGMAAAGGALAAASGGALAGLSGLAALGPVGLVGAGVAALAASMVNTKEFGDVALRNYWGAVESGRSIGETDPVELAQGFINFYRTNKNEFPGQAAYGRTGNEDFLFDMTKRINNAAQSNLIPPGATPGQVYSTVVQPWLDSMGGGPKDPKAKAIQDFMMTDLVNSFMQGKPISNAQVKGDKKFKIVSEKPTYMGVPPAAPTPAAPPTMGGGVNPLTGMTPEQERAYYTLAPPINPFVNLPQGPG